MSNDLTLSLENLSATTKAARLRVLLPLIEAKLAEGVRHAEILQTLNERGLVLTEKTYRNYLHRQRKQRQAAPFGTPTGAAPPQTATVASPTTAGAFTPVTSPPSSEGRVGATRPPTFDFDPRGIPDLLK